MFSYGSNWRIRRRRKQESQNGKVLKGVEPLEDRRLLAGIPADAILFDTVAAGFPEGDPVTINGRFDPVSTAPIQIEVNWGDAETGSYEVPAGRPWFSLSHEYPDDDELSVTVVQYDAKFKFLDAGEEILSSELKVRIENARPVIDRIDIPLKATEGEEVTFAAIVSDPGNDPVLITWRFGDGTSAVAGSTVSHVYDDSGSYTVSILVTDDDLGFVSRTRQITINNANPTAAPDTAEIFARGITPVTGNVVANDADAAGAADALVVSTFATESNPDTDVWGNFGVLNWEVDGEFSYLPDISNPTVQGLREGESLTDEFSYSISDGDGGSDISTLTITIVGAIVPLEVLDSDTAENVVVENATTGSGVGITAAANAIAGVTTTFQLSDSAGGRFQIDPSTGLVTVANGNVLNFESATQHHVTVVATASQGDVASREFLISLIDVNEPPIARPDTAISTDEDTLLNVAGLPESGLLANDVDPDHDPITVVDFNATSEQGAVVSVRADGGFQYDPAASASLQALSPGSQVVDTFSYTLADTSGVTAKTTVFVEVSGVADAPTALDDVLSAFEGAAPVAVTATLLTNDSDMDAGDVLTVVTVDTSDTLGEVTLDAGEVHYRPTDQFEDLNDGDTATDIFLYKVRDKYGLTTTARVTVTIFGLGQPENLPPSISDATDQVIDEGGSTGVISFTVDDLETAPGNLGVTATSSDTTLVPHANITLGGSGGNRTVTVVPAPNVSGTATITLTVTDGELETSDIFSLTVKPINDAPSISDVLDQTIDEDGTTEPLRFTVSDTESNAVDLIVTASSSDKLLVPDANIKVSGNAADRTVTVVPAADLFGSTTIVLTASDGELSTNSSFVLTVIPIRNEPHLLAVDRNDGRQRFDELTSLSFTFDQDVSASLDTDDLSLVNMTTNKAVDLSSVSVVWIPETLTARWDVSLLDFALGRYAATLNAHGIQDADGNILDGNGDGNPGDDGRSELVVTWQGDTDLDLDVDFVDYTNFSFDFGEPGTWGSGDFDASGVVDFKDFLQFSLNFGKGASA